jgi:hypothetical protein
MKRLKAGGIVAIFSLVICADLSAQSTNKFRRINDAQIRAQFTGMELSDGTHWVDIFSAGGVLTSHSMSKTKAGKWSVKNNELCLDIEKEISSCFEVWLAGKNVQLRHKGSDMAYLEGMLRRPSSQR